MLMIVVVALVALCYFGGNYCPAVLKKNKEMLLGGAVALVLCSFTGMRMEGLQNVRNGKSCELAEYDLETKKIDCVLEINNGRIYGITK